MNGSFMGDAFIPPQMTSPHQVLNFNHNLFYTTPCMQALPSDRRGSHGTTRYLPPPPPPPYQSIFLIVHHQLELPLPIRHLLHSLNLFPFVFLLHFLIHQLFLLFIQSQTLLLHSMKMMLIRYRIPLQSYRNPSLS